jgi:putative FmdB family regulatory protein
MPTYEYKCPAGHTFEKFYSSMNDQRRLKCPTCGKMADRQISGGTGLVFKGSGFYITDYKRAGSGSPESTEGSKPESKPNAKPEAKSEAKSETESKPDSGKKKKPSGDK